MSVSENDHAFQGGKDYFLGAVWPTRGKSGSFPLNEDTVRF